MQELLKIKFKFIFSIRNTRIKKSHSFNNIRNISEISGLNSKIEEYEFTLEYSKREKYFKQYLTHLLGRMRKNRIIYLCFLDNEVIFKPPLTVKEEVKRRLSDKNLVNIVDELTMIVRRKYKNIHHFLQS